MKPVKAPRWKRAGRDGEIEIKFPTGRRFKVEKHYIDLPRGGLGHRGEWGIYEYKQGGWADDWEWIDVFKPKGYAKQRVMQMGQYDKRGKKVADYSSTFQYESYQGTDCQSCVEYGSEFCPVCDELNEEAMTTADAGIPQDTKNMGPKRRRGLKFTTMVDRRRRKDKPPVLLKRFRKYMNDNA